MKKFFVLAILSCMALSMKAAPVNVDRIEPAFWFAGMKNSTLQLMVYGKDIREAEVTTDYPGVSVERLVKLDSPNYLLVYLNLSQAQPGTMTLTFKQSGKTKKVRCHVLWLHCPDGGTLTSCYHTGT